MGPVVLVKYRYGHEHRLGKEQMIVGAYELADPINVPIGITINAENVHDAIYFVDTCKHWLECFDFAIFPIISLNSALGQYYFLNRHAVAFFGIFIVKTNRYAAAILSQGH